MPKNSSYMKNYRARLKIKNKKEEAKGIGAALGAAGLPYKKSGSMSYVVRTPHGNVTVSGTGTGRYTANGRTFSSIKDLLDYLR